jgi:hypothetical protein
MKLLLSAAMLRRAFLLPFCFFYLFYVHAQTNNISGPTLVCAGDLSVYDLHITNINQTYFVVWSALPSSLGTIMQQNNNMATVHWQSPGNATVSARLIDAFGNTIIPLLTLDVSVREQPHPQIEPSFIPQGGCQFLPGRQEGYLNVEGYCENSDVTFNALGNGGTFTWSVDGNASIVGGTTGMSVVIHTNMMGQFRVTLTEQNNAGCIGTTTALYNIYGPPSASFTEFSHGNSMSITVCKGEELLFLGNAADPNNFFIQTWHWDVKETGSNTILGSGGAQNFNYLFNVPGSYTVRLYVNNCLGCSSVPVTSVVTVLPDQKPNIICPSVVCQGSTPVQYCTGAVCGTYSWSAKGGIIQGAANTSCVNVVWDQMPSGGYGAVTLVTSNCQGSVCNLPTTVEVPVIPSTVSIEGPISICASSGNATYSVPYWPGAIYNWSYSPNSGVIPPLSSNSHTYDLKWQDLASGFTVKVEIQHPVAGCISKGNLDVQLIDYKIAEPPAFCYGEPAHLEITPAITGSGYTVQWTIFENNHSQTETGLSSTTFPFSAFGSSGTFMVSAVITLSNGQIITCDKLVTHVRYHDEIIGIDQIIGTRKICPNQTYTYTASPATPAQINWEVAGGVASNKTGISTNITWGNGPDYQITVTRESADMCFSYPLTVNVCTDGTAEYTALDLDADIYEWSISPAQEGSIISGQGTSHITVLWHSLGQNNPQTGHVTLKVKNCVLENSSTNSITIHPGGIHLNCPDGTNTSPCRVCQNLSVTFYTSEIFPDNGYVWTVDNQVVPGMNGFSFDHAFTTPGTHYVGVTYNGSGTTTCPGPFSDALSIQVIPNPEPVISASNTFYCDLPHDVTLFATNFPGATSESFSWETPLHYPPSPGNGSQLLLPIGSDDPNHYIGTYTVTVSRIIDNLTCSASNTYAVSCVPREDNMDGPGDGVVFTDWEFRLNLDCSDCSIGSILNECGHVIVHGSIGNHSFNDVESAKWVVHDQNNSLFNNNSPNSAPNVFPINSFIDLQNTEIHQFTKPGFYPTDLQVQFKGSNVTYIDTKIIEIPLLPDFTSSVECCSDPGATGSYRLHVHDISGLAANNVINPRKWTYTVNNGAQQIYTPANNNPDFTTDCDLKPNDVVRICLQPTTETVSRIPIWPTELPYHCTRCQTITIPPFAGTVSITSDRTTVCQNTPVHLNMQTDATGIESILWNFGDNSYSSLQAPTKFYTGTGTYQVVLKIKLLSGCEIFASTAINVSPNDLTGSIQNISDPCGIITGMEYQPATMNNCSLSYLWSPQNQTTQCIQTPGSGVYKLTVTDCRGCTKAFEKPIITLDPFDGNIIGNTSICQNDDVVFSIPGQTGFTYNWTSDYPGVNETGLMIKFQGANPGTYHIKVEAIRNNAACEMLMKTFVIHPIPDPPTYDVSYFCDPFHVHIATDPSRQVDFSFNEQFLGFLTEYDAYSGGSFNLSTVSEFGCKGPAAFWVDDPINVDILSGCYTLCASDLHDCNRIIPAPPGTYTDWQWIQTDPAPPVTLASGHNSPVTDLCLLPSMAGKISLHVQNNYTSSNYNPVTGTTTNSTISCSAVSDPFCLTVTSCFVCPPLTVSWMSTLSGGSTPVLCGPYAEHVYHIQGNLGIPAGYNTCNNHPTLNGGYFVFTLFVVNPLNGNIQFDGFLHVTDIATFESVGLTGTFNLCNNTNGIVCPATLRVPPIMCMPGMNFNCDTTTTETVRGPWTTPIQGSSNSTVKYCFNLHYVNGTPCSITQYTVDINTTAGVNLAHKVFTGTPPSDLYQCVEFTINSARWASMKHCVNISIQSNCLEMGCNIIHYCGSGNQYGVNGEPGMDRSDLSSDGKLPYLKLTPNPVQNDLSVSYLSLTQTEDVQIMVFNSMGQLMSRLTDQPASGEVRLDVRDWTPGIYFVSLHTSEGLVQNAKVVVQH